MKVWQADWRKSLFYQPSNTSASTSSKGEHRETSKDASEKSSEKWESESDARKSLEQRTAEPRGSSDKERGSGDYNSIERARRNSSTYLQGERDSLESGTSVTEVLEDIVSIRIPVDGDALPMYQEPRHIIHAAMFDLVHASMWLWQEASHRVLWANKSARDAHQIVVPQRISMGKAFSEFFKSDNGRSKFISRSLKEVENGMCMLYLKGQSQHIFPCLCSNRKAREETTDIVELVIKPYILRGLHHSGDEKCCLVEIVNSLSNDSARDIEMFQANTGTTFLIDLNGRILCRKQQANTVFGEVKHFFDILSGTKREKEELMTDMHYRLYEQREDSIFLTEQSDSSKKWTAIEAKKSRDPVTYKRAFFLSVSDVTDMRNAEQTLISGFHAIKEENDDFWDDQRQGLRLKDHKVLKSETANMRQSIQLSPSPAEMVSRVLDDLIDGNQVSRNRLMFVQQVFSEGENCYEPLNFRNDVSMDLGDGAHRIFWELLGDGPDDMKFKALDENDRGRQWRRESLDRQNSDSRSNKYRWYMTSIFSWDFDVFKFAEQAKGKPLTTLAMFLMESEGLIAQFQMNEDKLKRYLTRIESGYPDNPYHNRIHACSVLHMTYMLISKGGMNKTDFQPQAILSCFLAAITHDFEHPGKTSDFLIRTEDKLAITYNDTSPLENYHMSSAWRLLMQPKYNFLDRVSASVKKSIRETWIDLVMATDMKKHLGIVSQFKSRTISRHTNTGSGTSGRDSLHDSESSNRVTLQMLVKIADLGHLSSPHAQHCKWVALLEEELFRQGDFERSRGLSVSTFMDRSQDGISKSQPAFFEVIALPTFEIFCRMFERTNILYDRVKQNYDMWVQHSGHQRKPN